MALERKTEYGKITISDRVFETQIAAFCQLPELYDRIWLAQKPNIKVIYNESNEIELLFSVYVKFGQSIKEVCKELADKMAEVLYKRMNSYPKKIIVNVAGVKSNSLVKRNMDIVIEYDNDTVSIKND